MSFEVRRIYEPTTTQGLRILVERLWPRGLSKEAAALDDWLKDVAPSSELRKWFSHEPERWDGFRERYHAELDRNHEAVARLLAIGERRKVWLLFSSREERFNNAVALRDYLRSIRASS